MKEKGVHKAFNQDWLSCKKYVHMDMPFYSQKEKEKVFYYITNPDKVKRHAFLPLIRRKKVTFPYKEKVVNGIVCKKKDKKVRNLTFASHFDAAIYSYYAEKLNLEYEKYLKEHDIQDVVVAYRKIKCEDRKGNKCNIDIALEAFNVIKENLVRLNTVSAITFDIKGFFDNLNHKLIKDSWKKIMGYDKMPEDVYKVYKSIVRYSYVYETELFDKFKDHLITKNGTRKANHLRFMRDKGIIAFCTKDKIEDVRKMHLIKQRKKTDDCGIPQGLPISAILANVYMSGFDEDVKKFVSARKGFYRRYSDDIIVICPKEHQEECRDFVSEEIKKYVLEIEKRKTNVFTFTKDSENHVCCSYELKGEDKKLEYLGFSFDGNRILIKDAGVGKFYFKMFKYVRRSAYFAVHMNNETRGKLFENKFIKKFTFAGAKTHVFRKKINKGRSKFRRIKNKRTYGNFLTYVNKSSTIIGNPDIKKQLRRASKKLRLIIEKEKLDVSNKRGKIEKFQFFRYGKIY